MGVISTDAQLCTALDDMTQFINKLKGELAADSPRTQEDIAPTTHGGSVYDFPPSTPSHDETNSFTNEITPYEQDRLDTIEQNKRRMRELLGQNCVEDRPFKKRKTPVGICNAILKNGQCCQRTKAKGKQGCHWHQDQDKHLPGTIMSVSLGTAVPSEKVTGPDAVPSEKVTSPDAVPSEKVTSPDGVPSETAPVGVTKDITTELKQTSAESVVTEEVNDVDSELEMVFNSISSNEDKMDEELESEIDALLSGIAES